MPLKSKKEYNLYMKDYMRDYRRLEREILKKAKQEYGWKPPKRRIKKRKGGK